MVFMKATVSMSCSTPLSSDVVMYRAFEKRTKSHVCSEILQVTMAISRTSRSNTIHQLQQL